MIIFEPYDYKSNNLIIRSHTTFDLSPHLVIHSSHCTWVKVIRGDYADYEGTNQDNSQYRPGPVEGLVTRSILLLVLV